MKRGRIIAITITALLLLLGLYVFVSARRAQGEMPPELAQLVRGSKERPGESQLLMLTPHDSGTWCPKRSFEMTEPSYDVAVRAKRLLTPVKGWQVLPGPDGPHSRKDSFMAFRTDANGNVLASVTFDFSVVQGGQHHLLTFLDFAHPLPFWKAWMERWKAERGVPQLGGRASSFPP